MYKKSPQGWLKHWDFILLDIFCLQLAFVVAYLVRQGLENPYSDQIYRTVAFVFMLCQIVVMFLGQSYQDILKRGYYIEFTKTAKHVLMVMLLSVLYFFATQQAVSYSRLTLFYTAFLYLCFDYVGRVWHKENVLKKNATKKKEKSMVVVVSLAEAKETIEKILSGPIQNFSINGLALIDDNPGVKEIAGIPVVGNMDTISEYLCHEWVDEVFVKISETEPYPQKLIDEIITMGLTVHLSLGEMEKSLSGKNFIEKIGGYSVITSSINTASPKQLLYKRLMDIAGGIVGCLLTVILIIVIGPMIYIKSPGPIFFSQVRIGKNGKKFKIYKFRSMYMDAEERKAELMSQNKMEGLMFKMDYDPRIIGSEKKDKNGNPKGIGNFIRKTSLDEFPQFWNVLKGDMSLVGTRPPTVDEWEKYELHHRSRMSIKPGITGMWQASGRSDITDFEEVVKLDTEYKFHQACQFYRITIKKFEDPLIINPWQISNIKMDAYTYILEESGERFDHSDIHMNSVIGINTGTENMVWLKPYKKAPRMQAERAYKKRDYKEFVVIRKSYGDKTLSESVKYVISLKNTDINGNMSWETIFAIPLEKSILLNKTICGYNAINYSGKTSCGKLKKIICKQFGIDSDAIFIEKI